MKGFKFLGYFFDKKNLEALLAFWLPLRTHVKLVSSSIVNEFKIDFGQ